MEESDLNLMQIRIINIFLQYEYEQNRFLFYKYRQEKLI